MKEYDAWTSSPNITPDGDVPMGTAIPASWIRFFPEARVTAKASAEAWESDAKKDAAQLTEAAGKTITAMAYEDGHRQGVTIQFADGSTLRLRVAEREDIEPEWM